MKKIGVFSLSLLVLVAVCSIAAEAQTSLPPVSTAVGQPDMQLPARGLQPPPAAYKLQIGDVLNVRIWGEPNLSGQHALDPQGYMDFLYMSPIYAEGLTLKELNKKVCDRLIEADLLGDPKVELTLLQVRKLKVFVLGQVSRPGQFDFLLGDRVMEALAQAGSFSDEAKLDSATITHQGSTEQLPLNLEKLFVEGDMTQNIPLHDGDTIFIPLDTLSRFFVMGEVNRPGVFKLRKGTTVLDAVSSAGGQTYRGSLRQVYVLRGDPKSPERIRVDVRKMTNSGNMTPNLELMPGDTVFVSEVTTPDWTRISNILNTVLSGSYLFRLFQNR
jgi:polysaccharide biosynthesis/export protein